MEINKNFWVIESDIKKKIVSFSKFYIYKIDFS